MRELVLKMSMTLDGYVCGPSGEADWIFGSDQEAKGWVLETISNASLHIMGSRTFQDMAGYWPTSTLPFAAPMNQIPKAVFSSRGAAILKSAATADSRADPSGRPTGAPSAPLQPGGASWSQAHVAGGDLADEIAALKAAGGGKPILAHGGVRFARSLIAHNLVDRYAFVIHPIALGQGQSIFTDLPGRRPLERVSAKVFPGGAVALTYRPV